MQSVAENFLDSLDMPNPDSARVHLNEAKHKLQDSKSVLERLQEALETAKSLPAGQGRDLLSKELQSNINRHKLLIERESIKLSVKEKYFASFTTGKQPTGN